MQAGLLGDHDGVDVDDLVAGLLEQPRRELEQIQAGHPFPLRIGVREMLADVTERGRTEQGVDDRVREYVRIGMSFEAERMLDVDAAKNQVAAGREPVDVVAGADPHVAAASCSLINASTTPKSSGVVSLMLAGSPSTTVTSWPVAATSCASSSPTRPASAASRCARARSSYEKACGVCASTIRERSRLSTSRLPSTRLTASRGAMAGNAAPDSIAAASTRRTSDAVASGRAASWTRT